VKASPNQLRHRVTIQDRSAQDDGFGQQILQWTDVLACWASLEPAPRPQQVVGEAEVSSRTHVLMIRYRSNLTPRMRVTKGARIFEIISIIDVDERHFWLQLDCVEGMTAG
jgi:SPP1 family predicted phage head-tail adaptor